MISFFQALVTAKSGGVIPPPSEDIKDIFDGVFNKYALDYTLAGAPARSIHCTYSFSYTGAEMKVSAFNDNAVYKILSIYIDGVLFQEQALTAVDTEYIFTLPPGNKVVEIIEPSRRVLPPSILGTTITSIVLNSLQYVKTPTQPITDRIVFLGDSITAGSRATTITEECFARLFLGDGINVLDMAASSNRMQYVASTGQRVTDTVAGIDTAFINASGDRKVVIALGTNDWGAGISKSDFKGWYEDLLDAINLSDNSIHCYCLSPIVRSGEDAAMEDIRDAVNEVSIARPTFTTFIDCSTILVLTDLVDGIHPSTSGHLKYYNAIKPTVLA